MKKIGFAVVGADGIARRRTTPEGFIPLRGEGILDIVAMMDADETRAQNAAVEAGVSSWTTHLDEILGDARVDAVYIATPTHLHYSQVMAAADAGKHIFCEKPMGLNATQCAEMVSRCEVMNVALAVNFMMRNHACHREMMNRIASGEIGKVLLVNARLNCMYPPIPGAFRQDPELGGGGSFIDMGNHCADLAETLTGQKVVRVNCFTDSLVHPYKVEDTAVAMLRGEEGAISTVTACFNVPDSVPNTLEIIGSGGRIFASGTIGQGSVGMYSVLRDSQGEYEPGQERPAATETICIPWFQENVYRKTLGDFCRAIREYQPQPISGRDGWNSAMVMDACYESARTGRAVEVARVA